jgi:hypothetical protein
VTTEYEKLIELVCMRVAEKAGNDWLFVRARYAPNFLVIVFEFVNLNRKTKFSIAIPEVKYVLGNNHKMEDIVDAQIEQALKSIEKLDYEINSEKRSKVNSKIKSEAQARATTRRTKASLH